MKKQKKKICIVTTARSDYGLLYWLMKELAKDNDIRMQIIVSGLHLENKFGGTYKTIEKDGFKIDKKVHLAMDGKGSISASRSLSKGFLGFAKAYQALRPDMVLVLGDRYELLAAVVTAALFNIPIAHIHGGEATEGAIDDSVRHAITKFASLHFASTEPYRKRIIKMGEDPKNVFCFGAPGLDNIYKLKLFSLEKLKNELPFTFTRPFALITYHCATLEKIAPLAQIKKVLPAIKDSKITGIFTMANADPGGEAINTAISAFCRKYPKRFVFIKNLGQKAYLSCMKHCDLIIGNSSSGIIESSSFKTPVVDIGDRQKGRLRSVNVLHAGLNSQEIKNAIKRALSGSFRRKANSAKSPYDIYCDGRASARIKDQLKRVLYRR